MNTCVSVLVQIANRRLWELVIDPLCTTSLGAITRCVDAFMTRRTSRCPNGH